MKKETDIVRYSAKQLEALVTQGNDQTDWAKVDSSATGQQDSDEADMVVDWSRAKVVMPQSKKHINMRIDADIVTFFKAGGKGWQTRMNAVLRSYMLAHSNDSF